MENNSRTARFVAAAIVLLAITLTSCGTQANEQGTSSGSQIQLTGTVEYGFSYSPVALSSGYPEYNVELLIKNTSDANIIFDLAEGAFLTAEGRGLRSKTTNIEKGVFEIEAGGEKAFEFRTDGYTPQLLEDAKGGGLFFQITLFENEKVVFGPRLAVLPDLLSLMENENTVILEFH